MKNICPACNRELDGYDRVTTIRRIVTIECGEIVNGFSESDTRRFCPLCQFELPKNFRLRRKVKK